MEGSLLRCQPVSWIKMTHLFTQEPHKVLLRTGRGGCDFLRGDAANWPLTPSRPAKSHYCRVWKAISRVQAPVVRVTDWAA